MGDDVKEAVRVTPSFILIAESARHKRRRHPRAALTLVF
jgi:hypothetical protein